MTVTLETFRTDYPEFADSTQYPDAQIEYWLGFAGVSFNVGRWGSWLDLGTALWVAHNVVMEARAIMEAQNGGLPGTTTGAISAKSADKISVNFDTAASTEQGGGQWNTTIYGTRYLRMARMIGAGPIQIGVKCFDPLTTVMAYPGPWFANFPNPSNS
jgi:hypothetical protein